MLYRINSLLINFQLIKFSFAFFVFFNVINISYAQKFILKYNIYETFSKNYFLNSEIYLNAHNTLSLGGGYLYQNHISDVSYGKFSCEGMNGLLEYRRYIDFSDKDTLGKVRKIRGFFLGGYGRIFNLNYSYDSLMGGDKYVSVTKDSRDLYSLGVEAGYHAIYRRLSFEIYIGYCLWWQYDYYADRFIKEQPFIAPADNISRWARHHIGAGIGYVFR